MNFNVSPEIDKSTSQPQKYCGNALQHVVLSQDIQTRLSSSLRGVARYCIKNEIICESSVTLFTTD